MKLLQKLAISFLFALAITACAASASPTETEAPPASDLMVFARNEAGTGFGGHRYGCIDFSGNIVIKPVYELLTPMSCLPDYTTGEADNSVKYLLYSDVPGNNAEMYSNTLFGIMDTAGKHVTECKYSYAVCFGEKIAVMTNADRLGCAVVDLATGKELTLFSTMQYTYTYAVSFNGDIALSVIDGEGGRYIAVLNADGSQKTRIEGYEIEMSAGNPLYSEAGSSESSPAILAVRNSKTREVGFMNADYEFVLSPRFAYATLPDANGIIVASESEISNKHGYFNIYTNEWITEPEYDGSIMPFEHGLAKASKGSGTGVINAEYDVVVPFEYSQVVVFDSAILARSDRGEITIFDHNGNKRHSVWSDNFSWDITRDDYIILYDMEGYDKISGIRLFNVVTGEKKQIDIERFTKDGDTRIVHCGMLDDSHIMLFLERDLAMRDYTRILACKVVLDTDLNVIIDAWDVEYVWEIGQTMNVISAGGEAAGGRIKYQAIKYSPNNYNSGIYAFYDDDFNMVIDNVKDVQAVSGDRIYARRGFKNGLIDVTTGEWLYSESIFSSFGWD